LRPEQLADERSEVEQLLAQLQADHRRMVEASADSNADDEHDPEGATIAFDRAQLATVIERAQQRLTALDEAEARVQEGSYGRCRACGRPIAPERLEARPTATTCISCAG
jgi:DnaK suppressor protein